jgi:hypothetical protein
MSGTSHDGGFGDAVLILVGTQATVALDAELAHKMRDELQRAIEDPDPAVAFLSMLTAAGVRDLPRFAYVGREEGAARLLLRGGIEAVERSDDGTETVHSAGSVSTWTEVVREHCSDISLRLPDGSMIAVVAFGAPPAVQAPDAGGPASVEDPKPDPVGVPGGLRSEPAGPGTPTGIATSLADEVIIGSATGSAPQVDETMVPGPELDLDAMMAVPVVGPADDDEVDLSHLFETRHVGVEAAAVRPVEAPDPSELEALGASDRPGPVGPLQPPTGAPTSLPPPTGPPVAAPPPPGLIAGVPGASNRPAPVASRVGTEESGDHDGLTISPAQLAALRAGTGPQPGSQRPVATGPQLQAVSCPAGHLNPPQADRCRACGAAVADRTIRVVSRPSLGHLSFDNGLVADIDRPMLIGRKPTVDGLAPDVEVPALVALPDPDGSLSRVHAEVRLEGWEVLLVDRNSTNGTRVEIPGQPPQLLRPNDPILITPGTRVVFADVVTATFNTGPR